MRITFTGIDEHTDLAEVRRRLLCHPDVEIGILATEWPEGRSRYPRLGWITDAVRFLSPRCAVHFCGRRIRERLTDNRGTLDDWFGVFAARRMQVNGTVTVEDATAICLRYWRIPVITQHTEANAALAVQEIGLNHQLLVDGSGGRGVLPEAWASPVTTKAVGFAGGLGPKTLAAELPWIAPIAGPAAWIDMESGIRNSADRFDIGLAEEALASFVKATP